MLRNRSFFRLAAGCLGAVLLCGACADTGPGPGSGSGSGSISAAVPAAGRASAAIASLALAELLAQPAAWRGRSVTVRGQFAGWVGGCEGPPPRSRSDWMLVDAKSCIYVSGPVPQGLAAPPDMASYGRAVTVHAQVELTDDGRPYLRR